MMPMSLPVPRYLVGIHPKQIPHFFTDVLIIGGGLAGLRAAIEIDQGHSVVVVTKDDLRHSNSTYAQGGIAGVLDPADRFEDHIADTLQAGGDLCDPRRRGDGGARGSGADSRVDRVGDRFDERGGRVAAGSRRRAQSSSDRPCPGRCDGQGGHAGGGRLGSAAAQYPAVAAGVHDRPVGPRRDVSRRGRSGIRSMGR